MKTRAPAFQFYPDEFVGGVAAMNQAEIGAYILLLCHQWGNGEIPTDLERAASIAKGPVSNFVMAKFPAGKNPRLEKVRNKRSKFIKAQSEKGKIGADNRWHGKPIANAMASAMILPLPDDSSPTPTPTPSPASSKDDAAALVLVLSQNPAYAGIDVQNEAAKSAAWCAVNRRKFTKRFFVNWLNRVEKPLALANSSTDRFDAAVAASERAMRQFRSPPPASSSP